MTVINVYAPGGKVRESWLQHLINTVLHPFLILVDFNQKHQIWDSMINTAGPEEIFKWIINNNVCILNTNQPTYSAYSALFPWMTFRSQAVTFLEL